MNRESILQCIQQELVADLAENGQPSPIGEMVPRVATLIRGGAGGSEFQGVLPVWQVAAFVDGGLDDDEAEKVCQSIQGDNSLLAEIIASVRASQMQPSETLSPALTASLTSMFAGKDSEAHATPSSEISALADPALKQPAKDESVHEEQTRLAPKTEETGAVRESRVWIPFVAAAVVILAVGIIGFQVWQGQSQAIVENDENDPGGEKDRIEAPELARDDPDSTSDLVLPDPQPTLAEEDNSQPESSVPQTMPPPETAIVENDPDTAPGTAPQQPKPETMRGPSGSAVKPSTLIAGLNWSQIDGFLTRRANAETNSIPDSASTRSANWQRIKVDSPVWTDDDFGAITVRTLPQSRAQAIFSPAVAEPTEGPAKPARLVLGPDSGIKLSSSILTPEVSQLELEYGSVALMDLAKASRVELRALGRTVGMLRVDAGSSLVVDYAEAGMRVQVNQGSLSIRGQTFAAESFAIARNGQLVPIDHSRTLPRWVNSSQGMLPSRVKDMVGDEQDIMQAIARKFAALDAPVSKRDQPVYAALARLQVSLAGSQFLRLASSKRPFLRIAAWNRLVSLQEWDPRYRATWLTVEKMTPNKRIALNFKDLARRVRTKEQYQRTQVEMLLNALESNNSSLRSIGHLFLWQAYPKGPAFDPNWPAANRSRSVNAWRSNLGSRPTNRANAAGNNPVP